MQSLNWFSSGILNAKIIDVNTILRGALLNKIIPYKTKSISITIVLKWSDTNALKVPHLVIPSVAIRYLNLYHIR